MVVCSPFITHISAIKETAERLGFSLSMTIPFRRCFLSFLPKDIATEADWPALSDDVAVLAICALLIMVCMNVPSSSGPTKTVFPTAIRPAFTNPLTTAPTPGTVKISSLKNSKGRSSSSRACAFSEVEIRGSPGDPSPPLSLRL